jgi:hypothetical protein
LEVPVLAKPSAVLNTARGAFHFFDEACNDTFDQSDLGVLETLKSPAIELETQKTVIRIQSDLDHLQDARFPGAPIAMHTDSYRVFRFLPQQGNDGFGDRLVIEEINLSLVV